MSIDWFTFAAQIINFLILVGLLRWMLYRPIIETMKSREQRIAERWKGAEQKLAQADELLELYQSKHLELDQQREQQLQEVHRQATELRDRLTHQARTQVESQREQWLIGLEREQSESAGRIRQQIGDLAVSSTAHLLLQLANVDLETLIVKKFFETLERMSAEKQNEIRTLMLDSDAEIVVRSAFILDPSVRNQMRDRLESEFGTRNDIRYETSQSLICGIQLDANGYSIEWNAEDLLGNIQLEYATRAMQVREDFHDHA